MKMKNFTRLLLASTALLAISIGHAASASDVEGANPQGPQLQSTPPILIAPPQDQKGWDDWRCWIISDYFCYAK